MIKIVIAFVVTLAAFNLVLAEDLYKININSPEDARLLKNTAARALLWIPDGYLVLADREASARIQSSALRYEFLAADVTSDQLAVDRRRDNTNAARFEVLFEGGGVRLLHLPATAKALGREKAAVYPLTDKNLVITYSPTYAISDLPPISAEINFDSLISLVSQDSLVAYTTRLEAFYRRLAGTDSNYAARDWIAAKFASFGYDSVSTDPFIGEQLWGYNLVQCYNVIAYKRGTVFPEKQIVIGGHFDAVPDCPGADDNASGTATVLEIARILSDIETSVSFVFVGFDSEESWMWGSYHYADEAVARGDDIILMVNPDMVAHETNTDSANLYYGDVDFYAQLWKQLADSLAGIRGYLAGSTASDHLPFQEAGFPVIFVQEGYFSTNYHDSTDLTIHLNFEYMTRMVQATLATVYTTSELLLPPVRVFAVEEPGDGQSLLVRWLSLGSPDITVYRVSYYPVDDPAELAYVDFPPTDSAGLVTGLTEGTEYAFYVQAFDVEDRSSLPNFMPAFGTPLSQPRCPVNPLALPIFEAVRLTWTPNFELDLDHYEIYRDGQSVAATTDTVAEDRDPALGTDIHLYRVVAFDDDGNMSDTVSAAPLAMKAATLEPDRVLAVNRSTNVFAGFVNETETGAYLREALGGYNMDYFSDTAYAITSDSLELNLVDLVDYGVLVVAAEGRFDALAADYAILDTLAYYISIGGRIIVFGRWGTLGDIDTVDYLSGFSVEDDYYNTLFHIESRVRTLTTFIYPYIATSDLVGAHSLVSGYPELVWDSLLTSAHTYPYVNVSGIPAVAFVNLNSALPEVLYTYDSRTDDPLSEGQPVAWRYLGQDYQYIWFDIPLSFFDRPTAIAVLQKAVDDIMAGPTSTDDQQIPSLPQTFVLYQNYPNPFNPATRIDYDLPKASDVTLTIYNLLGQKVRELVNEKQAAGHQGVLWDGTNSAGDNVATGLYLYRLSAGETNLSRKMLLLK